MGNVSLPIGSSNSGTNDWSDVHGEDQAIVDVVNGSIDNTNLASGAALANLASGSVTDATLASPNNSAYKTLTQAAGGCLQLHGRVCAAGRHGFSTPRTRVLLSGSTRQPANAVPQSLFQLTATEHAVAGLTTKLRLSR